MPVIELSTEVDSTPIEAVFDLSRSIDFHAHCESAHQEVAVAGVTRGLIAFGETVTWEAVHFGVRQRLTSKITAFDRPNHFRDSMVSGAFARFDHDHFFTKQGDLVLMRDVFAFESPLAVLGKIANTVYLSRYMRNLLENRNRMIKSACESGEWKRYVTEVES